MNIIFDMDGTLVDTAKIAIPAFERTCSRFGLKVPSNEEIIAAIGYANPYFYYKIYPEHDKNMLIEFGKEVEVMEKHFISLLKEELLFNSVNSLIKKLENHKHRLFIASTGDRDHVEACLITSGLYSAFDEIYCGESEKENMVKTIKEKEPKEQWLMVGDRSKDSRAARYNNIFCVAAAYGYCDEKDYDKFDVVINEPMGLLEVIKNRTAPIRY